MIAKVYPCKHCGKDVLRYPSEIKKTGIFCSRGCFDKHRLFHMYQCKCCGVTFHGGTFNRNFCSVKCRLKFDKEHIDPNKRLARDMINNAIKRGRITKQPCCICGEVKSQAHHEDYSKPLEVVWLCQKHHNEKHPHHHLFD